jgi:prepilin-type processing-associated H-X9-DG protein
LLPYLEEPALARNINRKLSVSANQNDLARNTILPIMRCPSDISESMFDLLGDVPSPPRPSTTSVGTASIDYENTPLVRLPTANYLGVFGTLEADETVPPPAGDGPIVSNRPVRYSDLQRGLSHTLTIGERTTAAVPSTWYGVDFRGEDAACRLVGSAITSPNCETCDECEFGSRHPGGSNFVWADGHVTLVLNDIDPIEYRRLSRRQSN